MSADAPIEPSTANARLLERLRARMAAAPTTDAVMRARTVLSDEIVRLRRKAALWRAQGGFHADLLDADADELESVREYLRPLDYPSATPADVGVPSVKDD